MLQAQTEKGELVTPAILTRQEQRRLKEKETFHCPECKDKVIFRLGNKVIPILPMKPNQIVDKQEGRGHIT